MGEFFQAEKLNNYAGGIARKYPEIKQVVAEEVMNLVFRKLLPLLPDTTYNIGIHQIRITTDDRRPGYPAQRVFIKMVLSILQSIAAKLRM